MLKKEGFPDENDIVLVTVTKVNPNSVFTTLDHFGGKTGLIHISEISPGRIRNIRDYVVEGKKIVCKILKIDKAKGHIDLSLRRVTEIQRRNKNSEIKQELKAEKLIDFFCKENKISDEDCTNKINRPIAEEYDLFADFFSDIVENQIKIAEVIKDKPIAIKLEKFVREKISPAEVDIKGVFKIIFFSENGLDLVKKILIKVEDKNTIITYAGAGLYNVQFKEKDFKKAEANVKAKTEEIEAYVNKNKGVFEFKRFE